MYRLQYGNTTMDYLLFRNNQNKYVKVSVDYVDGIIVSAPYDLPLNKVEDILLSKAPWILKKYLAFEDIHTSPQPREYISGEKFNYINRGYKLKVQQSDTLETPTLIFHQGKFIATVSTNDMNHERIEKLKLLFQQWYIRNGQIKINERTKIYARNMGVTPSKIIMKDQKMRWGTCTADNAIYINWRIMMAPMRVIDYVIVHELAHIKIKNHSAEYWQFVRSILPDYEERKDWLRRNGPLLTL